MRSSLLDDIELARRCLLGFGEIFAALGRGLSPQSELRRPDAIGARIDAAGVNPFFSSAVTPLGAAPPADDPSLPTYLWTVAAAAPGRVEETDGAIPGMGAALGDPALPLGGPHPEIAIPSLETLGDMNERAYGETGFTPLACALRDERIRLLGLREGGAFVCVVLTLDLGDDLGVHFVATAPEHRRRGLASALVRAAMTDAHGRGMRSATLQASAEGMPVWRGLGFRQVATLRAYVRPDAAKG